MSLIGFALFSQLFQNFNGKRTLLCRQILINFPETARKAPFAPLVFDRCAPITEPFLHDLSNRGHYQ